ncbi:MAG: flagellin, partial [Desulfovibrionaceae bacterium]
DSKNSLTQYQENLDTAEGWLSLSDQTLLQVSTLISQAKELAEQATSGTYDATNREQISYQVSALFDQLLELANTEYQGDSIYAGQKTDSDAFEKVLWMTTNDSDFTDNCSFTIEGNSDNTVLLQFYDTSGAAASGASLTFASGRVGVRFSTDGGDTFQEGTVSGISSNGMVRIELPGSGASLVLSGVTSSTAVKANTEDTNGTAGTWAWLRPSARYLGDDEDGADVTGYGAGTSQLSYSASGSFSTNNIVVRIDNDSAVSMDEAIEYSYSLDGGITWTTGNQTAADTTSNSAVISIPPGGILNLTSNGTNQLQPGQQFVIKPRTADIDLKISDSATITINDVGKDIFGGLYVDPSYTQSAGGERTTMSSSNATVAFANANQATTVYGDTAYTSQNLFETMGNLVAFLETNNEDGIARMLENLDACQSQVLTATASVGSRENRVTTTQTFVENMLNTVESQRSGIEDVDVAELMTKLNQAEIVYEAVLRSSSSIMQMSLMDYI